MPAGGGWAQCSLELAGSLRDLIKTIIRLPEAPCRLRWRLIYLHCAAPHDEYVVSALRRPHHPYAPEAAGWALILDHDEYDTADLFDCRLLASSSRLDR